MTGVWKIAASFLMAASLCVTSSGCNVIRITINSSLTPEDVAFIVPGKTTLADVVERLGAPDSITDTDTGIVATYRFIDLKYARVNLGWLAKPWTPVDPDLILSRTGLGVDAFEVLCDTKWVVLQQGFQRQLHRPLFHPYPFHPYPFLQSRLSPSAELPPFSGPAIMPDYGSGNIRPSVPLL